MAVYHMIPCVSSKITQHDHYKQLTACTRLMLSLFASCSSTKNGDVHVVAVIVEEAFLLTGVSL